MNEPAMARVFTMIASVSQDADARRDVTHMIGVMRALVGLLDFAYREPSYFAALVRLQAGPLNEGASTDEEEAAAKTWRMLVERFPLELEEQPA